MSFSSYDSLIAACTSGSRLILPWQKSPTTAPVANNWYHMWPVGGQPGAGTYTGTLLQWTPTSDTTSGALYHGGNVSTATKHLLYLMAMATGSSSPPPLIMIIDQVGFYPLTQSASQQSFDNSGNGAPSRYTSAGQSGLQVMLVATALGGSTSSSISTLTYLNQSGSSHTMPTSPSVSVTVSAAAPTTTLGARVLTSFGTVGAGPFIPLQAGDTGVQQLTNITFSAANTGNEALVLCKPLALLPIPTASVPVERDLVTQIVNLERVYDGACLAFVILFPTATSNIVFAGQIDVAWG